MNRYRIRKLGGPRRLKGKHFEVAAASPFEAVRLTAGQRPEWCRGTQGLSEPVVYVAAGAEYHLWRI